MSGWWLGDYWLGGWDIADNGSLIHELHELKEINKNCRYNHLKIKI